MLSSQSCNLIKGFNESINGNCLTIIPIYTPGYTITRSEWILGDSSIIYNVINEIVICPIQDVTLIVFSDSCSDTLIINFSTGIDELSLNKPEIKNRVYNMFGDIICDNCDFSDLPKGVILIKNYKKFIKE